MLEGILAYFVISIIGHILIFIVDVFALLVRLFLFIFLWPFYLLGFMAKPHRHARKRRH